MKNIVKKIEVCANLAIIIVAVLIAVILARNYFFNASAQNRARTANASFAHAGTSLSLPEVDWTKNDKTILLAISKGCFFCSESAPFYQRLARELSERKDARLIAVLPQQPDEGKAYLSELKIPIQEVIQAPLESLGVQGTPTILVVDKTGVVVDVWMGQLTPDKESEVLDRLKCKACS